MKHTKAIEVHHQESYLGESQGSSSKPASEENLLGDSLTPKGSEDIYQGDRDNSFHRDPVGKH